MTCSIYTPTAKQVARALITSESYKINTENFFTWKNGIRAPVYNDCRELERHPGARGVVICAFESAIKARFPSVNCIVGIAESGISWSAVVAFKLGLPHAFIRKQEKSHGRSGMVVGCPTNTDIMAVVVDDLLASGKTLEDKINILKSETGATPIGVQTIVNWGFVTARERFTRLGIPTSALVSYPDILTAAYERGIITAKAVAELTRFYQNPKSHRWNMSALKLPFIRKYGT